MPKQRWFVVLNLGDESEHTAEEVATWLAVALGDVGLTVYGDWDELEADREGATGPFTEQPAAADGADPPLDRHQQIAARNDALRTTLTGGEVLVTAGIQATGCTDEILAKVRTFADFGPDNDPYGEHDFGVLRSDGQRIYWKIDYYNATLDGGEDPLSDGCRRVLTVMLAGEY